MRLEIVPCFWEVGPWCAGWIVEKLVFPLAVAYVIYQLALRQIASTRQGNLEQLDRKRQIDFADKQLTEFYAPMLGARAEIQNHTVFDQQLVDAKRYVFERRRKREGIQSAEQGTDERREQYTAIDAELKRFWGGVNDRLLGERISAYIAMRSLFAQKMAFADVDTRAWYEFFYAFVEGWRVHRDLETNPFTTDEVIAMTMLDEERIFSRFICIWPNERTNCSEKFKATELRGKPLLQRHEYLKSGKTLW